MRLTYFQLSFNRSLRPIYARAHFYHIFYTPPPYVPAPGRGGGEKKITSPLSLSGYTFLAQPGQGRNFPFRLGDQMISLERIGSPGHHAENPSLRAVSRAIHADSACAPWDDGTPCSGASDLHDTRPRAVDGPDAPTSDVSANRCAQPPCTARARTPEIVCGGLG